MGEGRGENGASQCWGLSCSHGDTVSSFPETMTFYHSLFLSCPLPSPKCVS